MKIKPVILTAIIMASLSLGSCAENSDSSSAVTTSGSEQQTSAVQSETDSEVTEEEIVDDESAFMKAAPAYDTETAKSYIEHMPQVRDIISVVSADGGLTAFGDASASEEAFKKLREEADKLTADGHKLSFIMIDLETQSGVAFEPDTAMCTQSTIKAVYLGSVLDSYPDAYDKYRLDFRKAIVNSNNDSYMAIHDAYGSEPLEKWCEETGVDKGFAEKAFPRKYSARDMLKLWTKLYCFLNSDEIQHSEFASYYADSACSATKIMLGANFPVQTKAGWESGKDTWKNYDPRDPVPEEYCDGDPSNDESATNDTGVVYTDKGPYIFVIYSDIPFSVYYDHIDPNALNDLVIALNEYQSELK